MGTLHEHRLQALWKLSKDWKEVEGGEQTPWKAAIRECYDHLTGRVFGDVTYRTHAITVPLRPNGSFGIPGFIESGRDDSLPVAGPGYCAERKILENNLLEPHQQISGLSDIWLFYTTRSPCRYCGDAMLQGLARGTYKHIVVAFEGCYGPSDPERAMPGDVFFKRVQARYAPDSPGVELFKVFRAFEDSNRLAEEDDSILPTDLEPERAVYGMAVGGPPSRRRKDLGETGNPLRRETRSVGVFRSKAGDLAVLSGEVKDKLSVDDATLRFIRVTQGTRLNA
jgi:hypothetical protein